MLENWDRRQCPRCNLSFITDEENDVFLDEDAHGIGWWILSDFCPGCKLLAVWLATGPDKGTHGHPDLSSTKVEVQVLFPRAINRPAPPEVPTEFVEGYREACLILTDSPKASAALSRRCMQTILRERTEVPHKDLYGEIRWVIENTDLPSELAKILDIPRRVGNIGTHPMKSFETGAIADVEPWEAGWCLEVIESLYDHYFVMPARNTERLRRLEQNRRS